MGMTTNRFAVVNPVTSASHETEITSRYLNGVRATAITGRAKNVASTVISR